VDKHKVNVVRPVEASGLVEAEQRPAIRMQLKPSVENSRSNNLHHDRLVSQVYLTSFGYNLMYLVIFVCMGLCTHQV